MDRQGKWLTPYGCYSYRLTTYQCSLCGHKTNDNSNYCPNCGARNKAMKKKPTLYIDMDNVIFDTVEAIKVMYDEDFRLYDEWKDVSCENIKTYSFSELKLLTTDILIDNYFNSGRFFDIVNCIDGAELTLANLNNAMSYSITLVSIGTPENIKGKKEWVSKFNDSFDTELEFVGVQGFDKSQIDMSGGILIDDLPRNLENSNAAYKICFGDYQWNKEWSGARASNWGQVKNFINNYAKGR